MVDTIYTIGYSGFSISDFIAVLQANHISALIDVRSQPHSQWFTDYNKESLERTLKQAKIYYRNYADEFGARQEDRSFYSSAGYLDFERFARSPQFLSGINKITASMAQGYCFALMCAEKDPFNCHRAILVSRAFYEAGYPVIHLLPGGLKCTQKDIEARLLEKYFPNRDQENLFSEALSDEEYLIQAYRKRNAEIGYSIEDEDG